jgi:hypothetical protein
VALIACSPGVDDTPPGRKRGGVDPTKDLPPGVTLDAAPAAMHRLTGQQYQLTVRDLLKLGDADVATLKLPDDSGVLPESLTVSKLDDFAAQIVALGKHRAFAPCDVATGTPECASTFIAELGKRAFRHPLSPDETSWLQGVYDGAKAQFSFAESIDVVARVILQAPQFVYVYEEGEPRDNLPAGLLHLGPFEMASRLSYLFWDSLPDDALFDAASNKQLEGDGLRAQAERLLADPRSRAKMVQSLVTWMELDGTPRHVSIEEAVKDPAHFPLDAPTLRAAMRREISEFVGHVWDKGGTLHDLFTSRDAFVNGPLAQLYGVQGGPTGDNWAWTTLPDQRSGLLTRAGFLIVYSNPDIPSPIRRGSAILREFMCMTFPPPPPAAMDVKITGGETDASGKPLSIRDTVIARTMAAPECISCHKMVNPAGFALGHFDALGQWQDVEKGTSPTGTAYTATIDTTGQLTTNDGPVAVDGANQLSEKLATMKPVTDCVGSRFWRGMFGRDATTEESTSLRYVQDQVAATGTMREALLAIVASPAFQYMRKAAP